MIDDKNQTAVLAGNGAVYAFPTEGEASQFVAVAKTCGETAVQLLPPPPPAARALYDLETHLAALLDTEDLLPEDQEQEFALELHATLVATTEKRDRVGQFIHHLRSQVTFAHAEAARLREREQFYQKALDRMEGYVTRVIDMLGFDAKGKRKKLEGNVVTLSLVGCKKSVEVINEEIVPTKYKRVTLTLPADTWETVCNSLDLELRDQVLDEVKGASVEVSRSLAYPDLKADIEVPGLKLGGGSYVEVK